MRCKRCGEDFERAEMTTVGLCKACFPVVHPSARLKFLEPLPEPEPIRPVVSPTLPPPPPPPPVVEVAPSPKPTWWDKTKAKMRWSGRKVVPCLVGLFVTSGVAGAQTYSSGVNGISASDANTLTQFVDNHSGGDSAAFSATWLTVRVRSGGDACFYDLDGTATTSDTRVAAGEFVNLKFIPSPSNAVGWNAIGIICDTGETATWDVTAERVEKAVGVAGSGGAAGTEYTEDAAAAANPKGGAQILVRDDVASGQTTADGDNIAQRGTDYGAAFVQVVDSSGNFIDTFGGAGGTAQADRSAFTDGTTNLTPIGGVYNETQTDPSEDQAAAARITVKRALHVNLRHSVTGTTLGQDASDPLHVWIGDSVEQATVRDLGSNDSLNVAVVDGSGNQITSFGGGTAYTEDVATANPQVGTATMIERDDALAAVTPIEGDWIGLRGSAEGALWTQDFNSDAILADTTAILADTADIETAVEIIDNAVSGSEMQVDIVADGAGLATAANQLADGHNVTIDNAAAGAAVNIQDGGNTITVDGTVTATPAATGGGTEAAAQRVTIANDSTGLLSVDDNAGSLTVDNAGLTELATAIDTQMQVDIVADGAGLALNASVDGIEALLGTIDADTSALFGTVAGTELQVDVVSSALPTGAATAANQLADGHNVTVDNAAGAAAVNIQDGGNTITVDGTVTANLSATDNAVLDDIADGITVDLGATDNAVLDDIANGIPVDSLPNEGQQTAANSISVTPDTDNDAIGATGAAPPGEAVYIGALSSGATGGYLTSPPVCLSSAPIDITTATTTLAITGVAGRHVYICAINLVTTAANNVTVIAGTGATCGTSTAALIGGVTAAEGWNFAANGGLTLGSGFGSVMSTNGAGAVGDSVCLVTSAATQLSGSISYAIY